MWTPEIAIGVALGFLFGLTVHDAAHHFLANSFGDRTPRLMGRLKVNPVAHADPLGTYIFPAIVVVAAAFGSLGTVVAFGWTRPHAIGTHGSTTSKGRTIALALAGPAATAVLAFVTGVVHSALYPQGSLSTSFLGEVLVGIGIVAAALTIFELLPIPGHDGARVLAQFLSPRAAMKMAELAEYRVLFLLALFLFLNRVAASMWSVAIDVLTPFGA